MRERTSTTMPQIINDRNPMVAYSNQLKLGGNRIVPKMGMLNNVPG
jgi:hypothetical protein